MKRAHQKTHLFIWIILAPIIAAVLILSVMHRPAEPVNETLPGALIAETQ